MITHINNYNCITFITQQLNSKLSNSSDIPPPSSEIILPPQDNFHMSQDNLPPSYDNSIGNRSTWSKFVRNIFNLYYPSFIHGFLSTLNSVSYNTPLKSIIYGTTYGILYGVCGNIIDQTIVPNCFQTFVALVMWIMIGYKYKAFLY